MKLQSSEPLPTWPLTALFAGFPLFWLLGLGTMIWPLGAVVMLFYLWRSHAVTVPRGFGVWLLFLVWVTFSATQLDTVGRIIGFVFRLSLYLACTVVLVYAFNLASRVGRNYFLKLLTWFFMAVVAGGYLGLLMPTLTIVTPMSYVMPQALWSCCARPSSTRTPGPISTRGPARRSSTRTTGETPTRSWPRSW
jgi:hypothetical protein